MFIKSEHTIEEVISWMKENENNEYRIFHDIKVHISARMRLFKTSQTCVICGTKGTIFRLESSHLNDKPHLNLYTTEKKTKKGEFVIMTKDHIIPRSKGGDTEMENLQVMCDECNVKKGNYY
jgi:5-methylcytosine-specific restriction endonuclease McrA